MNNTQISIIIPIYNKEQYVERCLKSVIKSCDIEKTQIILIDDGSTDMSGEIADRFCENYDNIEVYHTTNNGVSTARNIGIDKAVGEYIAFVDADDETIEDSFQKAVEQFDATTEIYICGAVFGSGNITKCDLISQEIKQNEKELFDYFLTGGGKNKSNIQNVARKYMWGCKEKFYKRTFLQNHSIRFSPVLSRNEDVLFSLECYYYATKIRILSLNVYINYIDPHGLTSTMNIEKNFLNFVIFYDLFNERFSNITAEDLSLFYFQHTLTFLREGYTALRRRSISKQEYSELMKKYFSRDDIRNMISSMNFKYLSRPKKLAFFLTKNKLYKSVGLEMSLYIRLKNSNIHIT